MTFEAAGGTPQEVLHDRMRTAVQAEDRATAAEFESAARANEMRRVLGLFKGLAELSMPAPRL